MPIYVTFYHLDRTMVGKTKGEITLADLMGYLDDVEKARAVGYAKIFDLHACGHRSNLLPAGRREAFGNGALGRLSRRANYGKSRPAPFAVMARRRRQMEPAWPTSTRSCHPRTPAR